MEGRGELKRWTFNIMSQYHKQNIALPTCDCHAHIPPAEMLKAT